MAKRRYNQPTTQTTWARCPRCGKADTVANVQAGVDLGCQIAAKKEGK